MIKIEIACEPEHIDAHFQALGFQRVENVVMFQRVEDDVNQTETIPDAPAASNGEDHSAAAPQGGEPGRRRRRTKAEMEAARQANAAPATIDPQDEIDERAESEANKTDKLTHDDVRAAVERYTNVHGVAAAIENIPQILGCSVAALPDNQDALRTAIEKIDQAATEVRATKDDVVEAMKRYALKFDGQNTDLSKIPITTRNLSALFKKTFGDKVTKLSEIPPTPQSYGAALAAINRALT